MNPQLQNLAIQGGIIIADVTDPDNLVTGLSYRTKLSSEGNNRYVDMATDFDFINNGHYLYDINLWSGDLGTEPRDFQVRAEYTDGTSSVRQTLSNINMPNLPCAIFTRIKRISTTQVEYELGHNQTTYSGLTYDVEVKFVSSTAWVRQVTDTSETGHTVSGNFVNDPNDPNDHFNPNFRTRTRDPDGNVSAWCVIINEFWISQLISSSPPYVNTLTAEILNEMATRFRVTFDVSSAFVSTNYQLQFSWLAIDFNGQPVSRTGTSSSLGPTSPRTVSRSLNQDGNYYVVLLGITQAPSSFASQYILGIPLISGRYITELPAPPPPPPPPPPPITPLPFSQRYIIESWSRTGSAMIADITSVVSDLRFTQRRNNYGTINFKVDQRAFKELAKLNSLVSTDILAKHQTIIKLKREGSYLMALILTDLVHEGSTNQSSIKVTGKGLLFILTRRLTRSNLVYSNSQVSQIAWSLINNTQQDSAIGITQAVGNYSPVARDRTYKYSNIGEAIINLTRLSDGQFDFDINHNLEFVTSDPSIRNLDNLKIDRLIHFETMTKWSVAERGDKIANDIVAVSEGSTQITRTAQNLASINKFGKLQKVISLNDIINQATVQEHANAEVNNLAEGVILLSVSLPDGILDLNDVSVGHYIAVKLPDFSTLPPLGNFYRIEHIAVAVDSNSAERISLILSDSLTTADVQQQLDEIDLVKIIQRLKDQVNALGTNN